MLTSSAGVIWHFRRDQRAEAITNRLPPLAPSLNRNLLSINHSFLKQWNTRIFIYHQCNTTVLLYCQSDLRVAFNKPELFLVHKERLRQRFHIRDNCKNNLPFDLWTFLLGYPSEKVQVKDCSLSERWSCNRCKKYKTQQHNSGAIIHCSLLVHHPNWFFSSLFFSFLFFSVYSLFFSIKIWT